MPIWNSSSSYLMALLYLLLILLAPPLTQMSSEARVIASTRPLDQSYYSSPSNYVPFRPNKGRVPKAFGNPKIVEGCLPKGIHRSSAPSHYVNDQPLDSTLCSSSSSKGMNNPWTRKGGLHHYVIYEKLSLLLYIIDENAWRCKFPSFSICI